MSLYKILLPSLKQITYVPKTPYETNAIIFKSVLVYGRMGVGKTEVVRSFVEKAIKKYGKENVNAVYVNKGSQLPYLLQYGLNDKLVQIFFIDNATLSKIPNPIMEEYFFLRHRWYELTRRPYGYILSFIAGHRFHGVNTCLRTDNDCYIWLNSPTNPFDKSIVKGYIGNSGIARLESYERERNKRLNSKYRQYSVYNARGEVGLHISKLAKENYMKEVGIPMYEAIKELQRKKV